MKLLLLAYSLLILFSTSCRQEDTQGAFHINHDGIQRLVYCDTGTCGKCSTWTSTGWMVFDHTSDTDIYNKCKGLAPRKEPPPPPPVDKPIIDKGSTDLIQFRQPWDIKWGWDGYRDNSANYNAVNYISVEANGYARFAVAINTPTTMNQRYLATIISDKTGSLSFLADAHCVRCTLSVGETTVPIYARSAAAGTAQIKVVGESRSDSCCLAGPIDSCSGSQDQLEIHVYPRRIISGCRLYLVNNPVFNPSRNDWISMFDPILKQAVTDMDTVKKVRVTDTSWDINKNGKLDVWQGNTSTIPIGKMEILKLIVNVRLDTTNAPSMIVIPVDYRMDWLITGNASAGDSLLTVHTTTELSDGDTAFIGPWMGTTNIDTVILKDILPNNRIKLKSPLKYPHSNGDICAKNNDMAGFNASNYSFTLDRPKTTTVVHELLHQPSIADLRDVMDRDNIMYYMEANNTNTKLRFRAIECLNSTYQSQWDYINQ